MEEKLAKLQQETDVLVSQMKKVHEAFVELYETPQPKLEDVKIKEENGKTSHKRKRPDADWECEGQVWVGKECEGCTNCSTPVKIIHEKKKHVVCKSCKLKREKLKRAKKPKKEAEKKKPTE